MSSRDRQGLGEGDVAHQPVLAVFGRDAVGADIDHRRAGPDRSRRARIPSCRSPPRGCRPGGRAPAGRACANGRYGCTRAVGAQQQLRHRAADQVRPADHHGVAAGDRPESSCRSMDTPSGVRAREVERRTGRARAEPSDVQGMTAVDILGRIDRQQHVRGVDVPGSGNWTRMPCTPTSALSLAINANRSLPSSRAAGGDRSSPCRARPPLALAADVDLACRIGADQDVARPGLTPAWRSGRPRPTHALTQAGGDRLAVDQLRVRRSALASLRIMSDPTGGHSGLTGMLTVLARAAAPRMTSKADFGSRHRGQRARRWPIGLPSSAALVTRLQHALAGASRRFDGARLGTQLDRHTRAAAGVEHRVVPQIRLPSEFESVLDDQVVQQENDQQDNDRRDIDPPRSAACAGWPQHRLGQPVEQVDHHADGTGCGH